MLRRTFAAMGTEVELLLDAEPGAGPERALDCAQAEFGRLEQVLSRFREDSELSTLNRTGRLETASPDLVRVVELALEGRESTGGLFDPTVHDAVVAAGYDRSFDRLSLEGPHGPDGPDVESTQTACGGGVRVDGSSIELEADTRLDLGGIGKGYTVDRAADLLSREGPCLVNAGGDLAVRGGSWPIGVTDKLTLELTRGGMATSGRDRRRWQRDGEERHHLIDPATSRPATGAPLRVTVVADSAAAAEVAAKAAFLGADIALPHVLVTASGETVLAGGLA
jgi:FAD:protein FMN transferase